MASTDKLSCLQDEEGMPTHPPVVIQSISIQAFKAFKSKLKIGPLAPFTCIVGPNGTGKSVIGEALAFAFGASPAAMRAKSSSSIVNQDFSRQHAKASAKVSVKLERTTTCEKVTVRRVISEKSSKFYWKDENKKREISLTELKEKLATLSIPADNLDRFLVMQNRVSVKVKHPLELVKYLELVIGTSHYEEKIKELDEEIEKQSTEFESIQESLSEIQLKRQQLNPEVEKWKMFTEKWYEFSRRKASFLRKQGKTLQGRLQICREQKRDKSSKLAQIEEKRNSVQESLTKLNVECTQLQALLQDCRKKHKITEKQYNSLRIKMIKEEVQLKEAEKEVVQQKSLHQKEQDSLEKRRTDAQNEIDFLSVDVSKLESKKEQLCKEKEEAEEKRSYILSQASSSETSGLQVEGILDQEESLLNMKITRLQNLVDISNERRTKQASRVSQLVHEIEVSKKELGERLKFEEEEERKVSAIKYRLNQLHEETCLISEQKITRLKEEITKNEVDTKYLLKKLQYIQDRPDKLSKEDEAADVLIQKLKGKLHGRITDLAVVNSHLVKAVNSILCHLTNPATTFVVDDRDTANTIISYFQEKRIGITTCEILSELGQQFTFTNAPDNGPYVKPVLQDLQCLEKYQPVFQKYFGNWCVAKDLAVATAYLKSKGCYSETCNVVTEGGDIFRKDGEVIRANQNLNGRTAFRTSNDISKPDKTSSVLVWEEAVKQKAKQKDKLDANLTMELKNFELLKTQEQEAHELLQKLRESLKPHSVSNATCIRTKLERQQIELNSIQQAMEDDSGNDKLQRGLQELKQKQMNLRRKLAASKPIPACNNELVQLSERINQLDEAIKSSSAEIRHKKSSIKILRNRLETMSSCNKNEVSLSEKSIALASCREKFLHTKEQTQQVESEMSRRISEIEKKDSKLTELETEISKSNKEERKLRLKEVSIKNELSELMASETTTEDQLSKVLLALQDSCDPRQDKKVHRESNDLSSLQELANEAEDEEGMVLAREEMSLNEIRRSIHADALEEDVKYKKDESYLLTQSEVFSQMIESKRSQKDKLENDRFHTFREAIKKVNGMLSKIYQNLTKRGDAYLSLTEDKSLLFSEGVNLHVRPDRHKWRNFSSLSGGQQALASLALSFSLQAVFPSPFYFFDEIDAALDTKNARLVAEYMKKQTSAQYIVVSHRPQVYEYATSLVGVYHYNDASTCVTVSV